MTEPAALQIHLCQLLLASGARKQESANKVATEPYSPGGCRMQVELMSSGPTVPRKGLTVHAVQGPQAAADLAALAASQSADAVPAQLLTALLGPPAVTAPKAAPPAADSSAADVLAELCTKFSLNEEQAQALAGVQGWFTGQVCLPKVLRCFPSQQ